MNKRKDKISDQKKNIEATLISKKQVNHNSYIFKFSFPETGLNIQVGQHLILQDVIKSQNNPQGELVARKYTPIYYQKNEFDMLIKIYQPDKSFPQGGKFTMHLNQLQIGKSVQLLPNPKGRLRYHGNGVIELSDEKKKTKKLLAKFLQYFQKTGKYQYKKMVMIAGGTGIAPFFQIIQHIANNKQDNTQIQLLYGNKTFDDILLKKELDEFSKNMNLQIHYTLEDPPQNNWKNNYKGIISYELIRQTLPKPDSTTLSCICGTTGMNIVSFKSLILMGYRPSQIYKF